MVDPGVPLQCSSSGPAGTTWDHAGRTCPQVERGVPREAGQSPACPLCGFGHPCIPGPRPQGAKELAVGAEKLERLAPPGGSRKDFSQEVTV